MVNVENLRVIWDSLEPDPHIRLRRVRDGVYKVKFDRGDTSAVPGKLWARVLTGVDPSKKGGYALQGKRWIHSGDKVRDGDIVAYNRQGSGRYGNQVDLYVSAILDGEARILSFCNWSDRDEKASMIEDLADILKSLRDGTAKEKIVDQKMSSENIKEMTAAVRDFGREKMRTSGVMSDFLTYRTIGEYKDGCIRVKTDVLERLQFREGDICIVTIEIPRNHIEKSE